MSLSNSIRCVLFDLDGTLIDSAPDLAGTANTMRSVRGLPELPYGQLRPLVGTGARGMVRAAFGAELDDDDLDSLCEEFVQRYAVGLLQHTKVFDNIVPVLLALEQAALPWGIVTNKNERFALPVVDGLGLHKRAAVLICGDTTPYSKPHPEPLLEAARRVGVAPQNCVYVGDDLRDVQAGRRAGMRTLAAAWGYMGAGEPIAEWGAHAVLENPSELASWLGLFSI